LSSPSSVRVDVALSCGFAVAFIAFLADTAGEYKQTVEDGVQEMLVALLFIRLLRSTPSSLDVT
jgi:hypothetical protein